MDSINRLKHLITLHKVNILSIIEPLIDKDKISSINLRLQFQNLVSNHRSKIWIFGDDQVSCSVVNDSKQNLTLLWHHKKLNVEFLFTSVYAKCNKIKRRKLWNSLQHLNPQSLPWCVGGDFNIVRSLDERFGGKPIDLAAMDEFNSCL